MQSVVSEEIAEEMPSFESGDHSFVMGTHSSSISSASVSHALGDYVSDRSVTSALQDELDWVAVDSAGQRGSAGASEGLHKGSDAWMLRNSRAGGGA